MDEFTHLNDQHRPRMVDVSAKGISHRVARATGQITLQKETSQRIAENKIKKGHVLVTAELAGIQAAKQTPHLITLCHPLMLSQVKVEAVLTDDGVTVTSEIKCTGQTGVEMEALCAVSVALLTVYDMCKAVDKDMAIGPIRLLEKTKTDVEA